MKSSVIKEIRLLDKDMRGRIQGFPLFKVNFKLLRDMEEDRVNQILDWYKNLLVGKEFRDLERLYKENKLEYWKYIQRNSSSLRELNKLRHLIQIFVTYARRTMPEEIQYIKKEKTVD